MALVGGDGAGLWRLDCGWTEPVFVVLTVGWLEKLAVFGEATPHHASLCQKPRSKSVMQVRGTPDIQIDDLAALYI